VFDEAEQDAAIEAIEDDPQGVFALPDTGLPRAVHFHVVFDVGVVAGRTRPMFVEKLAVRRFSIYSRKNRHLRTAYRPLASIG